MVNGFQVVEKIREYLGGKLALVPFREWIVSAHIEIAKDRDHADPVALQLVSDIEGRYAEFSDEIFDEQAWRRCLVALLVPKSASVESFFFSYFYSASRPSEVSSLSDIQNSSSNSNRLANFGQKPDAELAAA